MFDNRQDPGARLRVRKATAVSSRGLGHSHLKAGTRVRIPLPLSVRGPFVYRLGRHPFTVQRGVRFPYGLYVGMDRSMGRGAWSVGVLVCE